MLDLTLYSMYTDVWNILLRNLHLSAAFFSTQLACQLADYPLGTMLKIQCLSFLKLDNLNQ